MTAGVDPSTGERIVLCDTVATRREAERALTRLLGGADSLKSARTKASFGVLLDRWLPRHDVGPSTRATYESLIRNHIRPALGPLPLAKLHRGAAEILEGLYGDLRRCSRRCDRRPFVEHRVQGVHDCATLRCAPHVCRPLAASSVRQIHAIISGALSAAVRWGWLPFNPAETARTPAKTRPQPEPPTVSEAARIVEEAWRRDVEWGVYVWLAIVTGARRGELLALRWRHVDLAGGVLTVRRNYVRANGEGHDKDTKSHQMRRLSIDAPTIEVLRAHRASCGQVLGLLGLVLADDGYLFSARPDRTQPRDPSAMTRRYQRMVQHLGIDTHLHELRHYSATELLTAGVDLRTVAGRLGHGDGTTTLRHYAAWVAAADVQAASVVSAGLPKPPGQQ
ncbi:MAG: site-specific integrase [Pseudonocardiales bacterium]